MAEVLDHSKELMDDRTDGDRDYTRKQKLRSKGWQVVSIPDNVRPREKGSYIQLTDARHAKCVINVYKPGQRDEMHCHPGSEHIFMVFQGELHIYGVNEGEDVILRPGEFVHINASYYYQLCNETDDLTVLYQVATKPAKPVKISRYSYRGPGGVDPATLESA
ncbi:MAG TPA: cupin domain-containing protein [Chloroflexota bacterium]|nr:cupin domain-containing protein [Chloroflexota bacterium]